MAFAFVLLAIAASPVLAHSQAVGGAGGTFLNGLLTWVQSNVLTTSGPSPSSEVGRRAGLVAFCSVGAHTR